VTSDTNVTIDNPNADGGTRPSEAPFLEARAPYPERISLDWTTYCNAQCFFCPRDIGPMAGEFVPLAKLTKLERVLSSVQYLSISSSIGEPLLHPELQQILQWLYRINPKILLRVTTNGTALTAEKAAWFAGHLDWLSVSLNASNGEAHMRDMFPHLAKRGIDAGKRWELHLRHLADFIAALPPADRPRVGFNMIAHRHNIKDIADFVRVVQRVGGSHATMTNILVHPNIADWSLYGVRDLNNAAVDEAFELGCRLGIRVDAPRFYTSVKTAVVDLDKLCREPIEVAYIGRSNFSAPCCQWTQEAIPQDVYADDEGFDRYWNHDAFRSLRRKRDLASCRVCNLTRVFDEIGFHLSPQLKHSLIASGFLSEAHRENDYPEELLVRTCVENRLDLPSIRHTLLQLNVSVEMAEQIETLGLAALPPLEQACWEAFKTLDLPAGASDIYLAGPFLGIGWGAPIHDPLHNKSARWICCAQAASIFVRVEPGLDCILCFTLAYPSELERLLQVQVCGRPIEPRFSRDEAGRMLLIAFVPDDLTRRYDGRLWVRIACLNAAGEPLAGWLSVMRFSVSRGSMGVGLEPLVAQFEQRVAQLEQLFAERDAALGPQVTQVKQLEQHIGERNARLVELERTLQATYESTSWRVTAPLRKMMSWLRRTRPHR
jgi:MoaA/NifB/PqqE/SkfB family radical SAM enzyme